MRGTRVKSFRRQVYGDNAVLNVMQRPYGILTIKKVGICVINTGLRAQYRAVKRAWRDRRCM